MFLSVANHFKKQSWKLKNERVGVLKMNNHNENSKKFTSNPMCVGIIIVE